MTFSVFGSRRRNLALIAVAASAMAACSTSTGTGTGTGTGAGAGASPLANQVKRSAGTSCIPNCRWNNIPVNVTTGNPNTEVAGINNSADPEIVGFSFATGTPASRTYTSFTSTVPITGSSFLFTNADYPRVSSGGEGTQMNAIATQASGLPILAGWVSEPADSVSGDVFAALYNQGLWSLPDEAGAGCSGGGKHGACASYLFGINDNDAYLGYHVAVGYDLSPTSGTTKTAYEAAPPGWLKNPVYPVPFGPGSTNGLNATNSTAFGINDNGDMVGTAVVPCKTSPSGCLEGWYALCVGGSTSPCKPDAGTGKYCWETLNYGTNTTPYAINDKRLAVGSYQDSTGTHGFLVSLPTTVTPTSCAVVPVQKSIDMPNDHGLTVVHGINNANDIVGWYSSSKTIMSGFVGMYLGSAERRRSRN
jgi:hypothetical protein